MGAGGLPAPLAGVTGGVVTVAGSRELPPYSQLLVDEVVGSLVRQGHRLIVGCSRGADHAALSSSPPGLLRVFAAFGPHGEGTWRWSAVCGVALHKAQGGRVRYWAGGGPEVALRVRLARRTRAVVAQASAGLVVFFASPASRGSALAARCAVDRGLPVLAFSLGFASAQLPLPGTGVWVPAGGAGVWAEAWTWAPVSG